MSINFDLLIADLKSLGDLNTEDNSNKVEPIDLSSVESFDSFQRIEHLFNNCSVEIVKNPVIDKVKNANSSNFLSHETLVSFSEIDFSDFLAQDNVSISGILFKKFSTALDDAPEVFCSDYF